MRAPIGLRISSRRKAVGISQAALARTVAVSPSYLNLIESNKRQVGGALLQRIVSALDVGIDELTGEAEHRLIHELVEAFADPALARSGLGLDDARRLVATQPDMAHVIAKLFRAYVTATTNAESYANRLKADPLLSQLLHQVLSGITAIKAGAEIIEDVPDLSAEERSRFLGSISREAGGLNDVAHTLIGQFDQASTISRATSIRREVDDMIFAADSHFADLEQRAEDMRAELDALGPVTEASIVGVLEKDHDIIVQRSAASPSGRPFGYSATHRTLWFRNTTPQSTRQFQMLRLLADLTSHETLSAVMDGPHLSSDAARTRARRYLTSYIAGAVLFPYERFKADAERLRYDLEALSEAYNASFEQIAHRLVTLRRPGAEGVPFGFLRSDPSGRLSKPYPVPGLLLPYSGQACPLWAVYTAFRFSGQIVRQVVRFTDGSRFLFVAKAIARRSSGFADQPLPQSVMLVADILNADRLVYADGLDLNNPEADLPVGPTCRLCTRHDCLSRQEEAFAPNEAALI